MALPQPDPSLPGGAAPVFGDTDAARGDHLRANNQAIWENLEYLNDGENINDAAAATPVDADRVGFFQIVGAVIKCVTFANLFAYIVSKLIAVTTKTTPVDADAVLLRDSAASDAPKWLSFTNLKAFLKTYFDTLYVSSATGAVLQEVTATDAGGTTTSTSLTNVNVANISITPKSTNSILIIDVQFQGVESLLSNANTVADFRIYETTGATDRGEENRLTASAQNDGVQVIVPANIRARLTNSALTTRTFQLRARTSHAGAAAGATKMVWSIREIQG